MQVLKFYNNTIIIIIIIILKKEDKEGDSTCKQTKLPPSAALAHAPGVHL
jgi:hypothetical protein